MMTQMQQILEERDLIIYRDDDDIYLTGTVLSLNENTATIQTWKSENILDREYEDIVYLLSEEDKHLLHAGDEHNESG
jgi:hypothetical protein